VNQSLLLHTAARRYCLERYSYWFERYSEIVRTRGDRQEGGYTAEALRTFPRYNILNAIRIEIERIDPDQLCDAGDTKALLVLAGEMAEDDFTRRPIGGIDSKTMAEEREAYCAHITGLTPAVLNAIGPLPYRRVLASGESQSAWSHLQKRWQIPEGLWHSSADKPSGILIFNSGPFEDAVIVEEIRSALTVRGIERVLELREYGPEYEEDLKLFEPCYNGAEGYWSSEDLDWIIYASHEGTVAIGGWLLGDVKAMWPSWTSHLWTGATC
jgi:hypothetical protein